MNGTLNVTIAPDTFEPGIHSIPELLWLMDHMKEPPVAAFHDFDPENNKKHRGVMRPRVEPLLARLYELAELEKHRQEEWAGFEALEDSITRYLAWHERVQEMKRRGFRRGEPSMFHWDEQGEPYKYAIGCDSGEMVRTEIMDDGTRKPFGVQLTMTAREAMSQDLSDVAPWINRGAAKAPNDSVLVSVKGRMGVMTCSICGKAEEFDAANRTKRAAAHARMGRHLGSAKQERHRHLLLKRRVFK